MVSEGLERPILITSEAHKQITETLKANKIPETYGLRVGVRGGGCGSSWQLGFDEPGPADQVYVIDGVRVIIDVKHLLYVLGAQVGYEASEDWRGFTITKASELEKNPQ
ncbi:iron-sulfur cluster assembly accessory protein [Tellurirhabdus rosea]|uniref:iron-sulfur cluster assembly accessory protein n=1 Tax=Tellurirhabdus rosea TaxID=2674997 RepID=UPI002250461F|nr:iron-sulfur cluster assembly accessory protein [Tellurirhabdus rosea]